MSSHDRSNATLAFRQLRLEEIVVRKHIHTACLFILAMVGSGAVLVNLKTVLVPFTMALMLFYSLVPIVDALSVPSSQAPRRGGYEGGTRGGRGGVEMSQRGWGSASDLEDRSSDDEGVTPNGGVSSRKGRNNPRSEVDGRLDGDTFNHYLRSAASTLARFRLPRPLAVIVALCFGCLFIGVVAVVVLSSINELAANSTKYTERIHAMVNWLIQWGGILGIDISKKEIAEKLLNYTPFLSELLLKSLSVCLEEMSNGFLMLLFTVYLLIGYKPRPAGRKASGVRAEIDNQIKRYIGFKVLLSALTGLFVGVVLMLLKVDLALVFGLLAFLLNFVPNVGAVVSTLLPMPVVLFDPSKTWTEIFLVVFLPLSAHTVIGNVIEPRVLGDAMDLHPIVVLLSLMLWGSLWGVVGMILSVPITAVLKICLHSLNHPLPRFLATAMEGRLDLGEAVVGSSPGAKVFPGGERQPSHFDLESGAPGGLSPTPRGDDEGGSKQWGVYQGGGAEVAAGESLSLLRPT